MASSSSSYILAGGNIPITARDTQRAFHLDNLALYLKKEGSYEKETVDGIEAELDSLLVFNKQFISDGGQEVRKHAYTSLVAIAINNVLRKKGFDHQQIEEVILGKDFSWGFGAGQEWQERQHDQTQISWGPKSGLPLLIGKRKRLRVCCSFGSTMKPHVSKLSNSIDLYF